MVESSKSLVISKCLSVNSVGIFMWITPSQPKFSEHPVPFCDNSTYRPFNGTSRSSLRIPLNKSYRSCRRRRKVYLQCGSGSRATQFRYLLTKMRASLFQVLLTGLQDDSKKLTEKNLKIILKIIWFWSGSPLQFSSTATVALVESLRLRWDDFCKCTCNLRHYNPWMIAE